MSIQQVSAYRVGELVFSTIKEAQKKELLDLSSGDRPPSDAIPPEDQSWVDFIVDHTDEVVAILTCQPKPKAPRKPRSDIGKKRSPKEKPTLPV